MKTTGIVRNIDELGRIVIPKETRKHLDIKTNDPLEISTIEDTIVIQKYVKGCTLCGSSDDVMEFHDKKLCGKCIAEIKREL